MTENERRLEDLMQPHSVWSSVTTLTADDSDVEVTEADPVLLRRVFDAYVRQIGVDAWLHRRDVVAAQFERKSAELVGTIDGPLLSFADTIGWYLYLCELAIARPHELPTYYSSRVLPFLGVIGSKLRYAGSVQNLDTKLRETMADRRLEPDGFIFEVLVALSYAECGWAVEFLPEGPGRTPDLSIAMHGQKLSVECKRMSSRSQYAIEEESNWREHWSAAETVLRRNGQWIWLDVMVHVELTSLPLDWLAQRLEAMLPLQDSDGATADETATVRARVIDRSNLDADLSWSSVKLAGSKLRHLLGGDWVQENATTSLAIDGKTSTVGSVPGHFATYFDSVDWASGATFSCNSDHAIERKARDVKATIARAVRQVPTDSPSILHIAFETLEGPGVEEKRMQKIIPSIEGMTSMSLVIGIILHALGPVDSTGQVMVIDETASDFWRESTLRHLVPRMVVLPAHFGEDARDGAHWN